MIEMDIKERLLKNLQRLDDEREADQLECYNQIAKDGGYVDFAHLKANKDELSMFSKILFDIICREKGFDPVFGTE